MSDEVRDGAQFEFLRVFIANHNGKRIVESERRANVKTEAIPVGISNRAVDRLGVIGGRFGQDGGESRARIFGVEVHLSGEHGAVADKRAAQIQPAIDPQGCMGFDLLGQQLGEDDLFGEIFGAGNHGVLARAPATPESRQGSAEQRQGIPSREALGHFAVEMGSRP